MRVKGFPSKILGEWLPSRIGEVCYGVWGEVEVNSEDLTKAAWATFKRPYLVSIHREPIFGLKALQSAD